MNKLTDKIIKGEEAMYYFIKKDGDQWCATYNDFKNLMESPAEFGKTPQEALQKFIKSVKASRSEASDER